MLKRTTVICLFILPTLLYLFPITQASAQAVEKNDYSRPSSWLCRPGQKDACAVDLASTVITHDGKLTREAWEANPDAPIDCFYIYPTVSKDLTPNSDMLAGPEEKNVIQQQFARFGSQCRLYAPLYRQITLSALLAGIAGKSLEVEGKLAYHDVLDAWKHYLRHDNQGRGVVLIGHSQGSLMLIQLIKEEIEGKPAQAQIVSAMLIGANVMVPAGNITGGTFQQIPLCRKADDTGCVITYVSFRANVPPPENSYFGRRQGNLVTACTNPVSLDGNGGFLHAYLPADGSGPSSSQEAFSWVTPPKEITTPFVSVPGLLGAKCVANQHGSYLEMTVHGKPKDPRTDDIKGDVVVNGQIQANWGLHVIDVNLAMGNLLDIVNHQGKAYLNAKKNMNKRASH